MAQKNIILILCDQMRGDAFGAAGNSFISTPNLDAMAARGTRFNHAYSAVPSCIPARAILWTGQDQWHAGILGMGSGQGPMPCDYPHTLAGELTKAGYCTHLVGKGHFHPQRAAMGFESIELDESGRMNESEYRRWFRAQAPAGVTPDDHGVAFNSWHARPWHTEERLHPSAWTMSRALEFLECRPTDKPFFLNISFARPHSPYVPPEYYFSMYDRQGTPPAAVGDWATIYDAPLLEARDPNAWHGSMSDREIHRARSGYYGDISFIDTQIGRLLNWMQRLMDQETRENTWLLFSSDHGDMLGDHNLWRKTYAYEGSARIPMLLVPPRLEQTGKRDLAEEVVELRDVMPTLLDLAGLESPATVDGRSLVPLLREPASDWRPYIHGEHCTCYNPAQEMQYVTNGLRKFIWLPRIGIEQFFDLQKDPEEKYNLIEDPGRQPEIAVWRGYLIDQLAERDCGWVRNGRLEWPGGVMVSPFKENRRTAADDA